MIELHLPTVFKVGSHCFLHKNNFSWSCNLFTLHMMHTCLTYIRQARLGNHVQQNEITFVLRLVAPASSVRDAHSNNAHRHRRVWNNCMHFFFFSGECFEVNKNQGTHKLMHITEKKQWTIVALLNPHRITKKCATLPLYHSFVFFCS